MADESLTLATLTRFYREVTQPDIERIVSDAADCFERRIREQLQARLDELAQRMDRLIANAHAFNTRTKRIE